MENKRLPQLIIDGKVTLTMIIVGIIGLMTFAFRYRNYEPYAPVTISFNIDTLYTKQLIQFTAHAKNITSKDFLWDFGDKTSPIAHGASVTHDYKLPGRYIIHLTIDGQYIEDTVVYIKQQPPPPNPMIRHLQFFCPDTAYVGEPVQFKDSTPNAHTWEWKFGEDGFVDDTTQSPVYKFQSEGTKIITLVVNRIIQGEAYIDIFERPTKPIINKTKHTNTNGSTSHKHRVNQFKDIPINDTLQNPTIDQESHAEYISDDNLKKLFVQVIEGKLSYKDLLVYISPNVQIYYDNDKKTLEKLCDELKKLFNKKKKNISRLEISNVQRNDNKFIITMSILAEKKSLFEKITSIIK